MNESSWGARPSPSAGGTPPGAGPWPPGSVPAAPSAGPAHEWAAAAQTRPMPTVPDAGGDQDDHRDERGAARLSGPLFHDDQPQEPMPTSPPAPDDSPSPEKPAKKSAGRNLRAAIGVGVGLGAVIVLSLFVYKPVFVGVIAVAVVVGLWELTSRLAERKDIRVPLVPLAVGGTAMVVAGYVRGAEGAWVAMALTALAVLVWRMTDAPDHYLRDVTAGVFAAFYVPFLATFVALMLAADADGPWRVLTFLLLTVVSDTGAYAVGWRFGKKKLAPRISPGKTREGLVGAVTFAMAAGALCMQFLIEDGVWWQGLLLGLAVAASATLGDLGESMIKRDLGIKDMGTLLPGHGGIMDRLDSLLPTAPVVWLLLVVFVGTG
ncbi:phosphatidate cytidylyltransferase [Streptomyces sp. Ru73]|uniref:phosphatidate cytidylyltransferase n=1 Tax=Streptomyces sp. Ru73 TaxID=2080748 RepID=UPI000CDE02DE|nr:phosphatidate cytidylyltransferase [Streptomyces sp. Ru73]POX36278.1 phosphatidate cytidylyltransferase [Streptomyces sp. Ru73]